MREKKSRFEINREVRRVLTRNGADTNLISFQVYGKDINLFGNLIHGDGTDFGALEVENLLTDFSGSLPGYNVMGDTTGWAFSFQEIRKITQDQRTTTVVISDDDGDND